MVEYFSFCIGCAFSLLTFKTLKVANRILPYFRRKSYLDTINSKSLNIAVISGSTDGLGKSFARKLFKHNFHIILLGRSQTKLESVAQEINSSQSDVGKSLISPYLVDFGQMRMSETLPQIDQLQDLIEKRLKTSEMSNFSSINIILINSCGDSHISRYENTSLQGIERMQSVNINSFHFMLQVFFRLKSLEFFKNMSIPKEYIFINVSSGVDKNPNLYSSIYSGSKAYCSNVMKVLNGQNKTHGKSTISEETLHFLNLTPLYIKTKMIRYLNQWDVMEPQSIVDGSFKILKRRSEGAGSIMHELLKQFPFIMNKKFDERVNKALQFRNKMIEIENKRKNRKKISS